MLPSCYDSSFHRSRHGFGSKLDCHERVEIYFALRIHELEAILDLAKRIESNIEQRHFLAIGCNAVARIHNQYEPTYDHIDICRITEHGWFDLCLLHLTTRRLGTFKHHRNVCLNNSTSPYNSALKDQQPTGKHISGIEHSIQHRIIVSANLGGFGCCHRPRH
jgi:hypothetical protein